MQFSKGPLRGVAVGPTRLWGDGLGAFAVLLAPPLAPLRALTDAGELLQADQGVGVRCHNGFRDGMVDLQFQPSLSPA